MDKNRCFGTDFEGFLSTIIDRTIFLYNLAIASTDMSGIKQFVSSQSSMERHYIGSDIYKPRAQNPLRQSQRGEVPAHQERVVQHHSAGYQVQIQQVQLTGSTTTGSSGQIESQEHELYQSDYSYLSFIREKKKNEKKESAENSPELEN